MFDHHAESIENVKKHFSSNPTVLAVLLSGSIAHGFQTADSDVDIQIVVSEDEHQRRRETKQLTFYTKEEPICTYADRGGYVEGKFILLSFLRAVAERGSEPARFAFQGARVIYAANSTIAAELEDALRAAAAYPIADREGRMARFRAQFEAWRWYSNEAARRSGTPDGDYLSGLAASKLVLFGGRLVLAHNMVLYPYHKWFMRVLEGPAVVDKPEGMVTCARRVLTKPSAENVQEFYEMIKGFFHPWPVDSDQWSARFMEDSELTWVDGRTSVDDL